MAKKAKKSARKPNAAFMKPVTPSTELAEVKVANRQLLAHMKGLEEKIALLKSASAACPVCGQPLSAADAARLSELS